MRSFSRLIERRKVDLPQPDGPMIAVTALRSMAKFEVLERLARPVGEAEAADVHRRRAALAGRRDGRPRGQRGLAAP